MRRLRDLLGAPVDAASLGLFRSLWGLLIVWESLRKLPKATGLYSPSYFHFRYPGFEWVQPLPLDWMVEVEILAMTLGALGVATGVLFRTSSVLFGLVYTHLFLVEKLYYNNHFYLTILITFLLGISRADREYSIPAYLRSRGNVTDPGVPTLPFWNVLLLRAQIVIVYFFGGLAKLNADWLAGEPVRFWFRRKELPPPIGWVLHEEWFIALVTYGGLLFDLSVGFLLLFRPTFPWAVAALVGFHLTNHQIFRIGLFPLIGVAATTAFLAPDGPRRFAEILARRAPIGPRPIGPPSRVPASPAVTGFVIAYLAVQVLVPFRHHLYGHDPSWTEVGHDFSWRMMLRHKDGWLKFVFEPPEAEHALERSKSVPRIGQSHLERMVKTPHYVQQYAHALRDTLAMEGFPNAKIRVISVVSLNGRPYQLMIDPTIDIARAGYAGFGVPEWILPLDPAGRAGGYPATPEERKTRIEAAVRAWSNGR